MEKDARGEGGLMVGNGLWYRSIRQYPRPHILIAVCSTHGKYPGCRQGKERSSCRTEGGCFTISEYPPDPHLPHTDISPKTIFIEQQKEIDLNIFRQHLLNILIVVTAMTDWWRAGISIRFVCRTLLMLFSAHKSKQDYGEWDAHHNESLLWERVGDNQLPAFTAH